MLYRVAADAVLVLHLAFILFAVSGGLLVLRWRWLAWLHLPAAAWAALIEFAGWYCPLTPLENSLRQAGGQRGFQGGFVEHYLVPLIYPSGLTRDVQVILGLIVVGINLAVYLLVLRRRVRIRDHAGYAMIEREKQLQGQIDDVIRQLQKIQRDIAGTRQPASRLELARLEELGRDYAALQQELQAWYARSHSGDENDDRP